MDSYDKWLTTEPEAPESKCKCCWCGEELYEDEEYWELEDEIYCELCAEQWLECRKNWVTAHMVRGD